MYACVALDASFREVVVVVVVVVVVCRVLWVGRPCDVGAMQGAADGRRAQQRRPGGCVDGRRHLQRGCSMVGVGGIDGNSVFGRAGGAVRAWGTLQRLLASGRDELTAQA
jgi:hypothetical protein